MTAMDLSLLTSPACHPSFCQSHELQTEHNPTISSIPVISTKISIPTNRYPRNIPRDSLEGIRNIDELTFALRKSGSLSDGYCVHAHIIQQGLQHDPVLEKQLIRMYSLHGALQNVGLIFSKKLNQDVVDWTRTIQELRQLGYGKESLEFYHGMEQYGVVPDRVTFLTVILTCSFLADLNEGKAVHDAIKSSIFYSDVVLGNALIDMYGKCDRIGKANTVFDEMRIKDLVTWNNMIKVNVQNEDYSAAFETFNEMLVHGFSPDPVTYVNLLDDMACEDLLHQGNIIHCHAVASGFEAELRVGTSLISMYAKCGCLQNSWRIFHKVPKHDLILYNAMIAGCAFKGHINEAVQLYKQLESDGLSPNARTFVSLLDACANSESLIEGEQLHCRVKDRNLEQNVLVGTALVNLYAKCGNLDLAKRIFDQMTVKDVIAWNTMFTALAQHGEGKNVLFLFEQMKESNFSPNKITFLSVLSACCHSGMINEGRSYFRSMRRDYGIFPMVEHYNILVDILVRAGQLKEAEDLIYTMPFRPLVSSWRTLLSACRNFMDFDVGQHAAKYASDLDPMSDSVYVILSELSVKHTVNGFG